MSRLAPVAPAMPTGRSAIGRVERARDAGSSRRGIVYVLVLVAALVLPSLMVIGLLVLQYAASERYLYETQAARLASAMAATVSLEIENARSALLTMSTSDDLEFGRLERFHSEAQQASRLLGREFVLFDSAQGRQILKTSAPWGQSLAAATQLPGHEALTDSALKPVVSRLVWDADAVRWGAYVTKGVQQRDGHLVILAAVVDASRITSLLRRTPLAAGWYATVRDQAGALIARSDEPLRASRGQIGSISAAAMNENSRWRARADGVLVFSERVHLPDIGWILSLNVPHSVLMAPLYLGIMKIVIFGALIATLGLLVAFWGARRLTDAIAVLAGVARQMSLGAMPEARRTDVREIDQAVETFMHADRQIRARTESHDKAEQGVRASEERLRVALEAGRLGSFEWDVVTNRVALSALAAELLGLGSHDTEQTASVGRLIANIRRETRPDLFRQLRTSRDGVQSFKVEGCTIPRAGNRWLAARGHVLIEGGSPRLVRGVVTDVTQQRETQEVLDFAYARLSDLSESLDLAAVVVRNPAGIITHWTKGCERLYGWPSGEALGRSLHHLLQTEFPETQEASEAICRRLGTWEGEVRQRTKSGAIVTVSCRWAQRSGADGQPVAVTESVTDITELRAAYSEVSVREAQIAAILAAVPDAIIITDAAGRIQSLSHTTEQLFGYDMNDLRGKPLLCLFALEGEQSQESWPAQIVDGADSQAFNVLTGKRADGSAFAVEVSASAGQRAGTICFVRDISQRDEQEQHDRQAQKMEAIGLLTGGVAHDFANLLTVIIGNIESLETRARLNERHRAMLADIKEAADLGGQLTAQLLAFARKQPLTPTTIDIGCFVLSIVDLLRRTLGSRIVVETQVEGSGFEALVDKAQLETAILNLAINARDAMPDGGRITISVRQLVAKLGLEQLDTPCLALEVSDTGTGMSAATRDRVFEPFFTTKAIGTGTGLGLSSVHGFVTQSGGAISLTSEPGRGTTVRILLPAIAGASAVTHPATHPAIPGAMSAEGLAILVVDDDARVRRATIRQLLGLGYRVLEAGCASDALELLRSGVEIDMLFTDVIMPGGILGDELALIVKKDRPDLPILITSGYSDPGVARELLDEQTLWMKKPYSREQLRSALVATYQSRRRRDGA